MVTPVICGASLYWQRADKKLLKRIDFLIQDTQRSPFEGIEKPEPLKHALSGYWSSFPHVQPG